MNCSKLFHAIIGRIYCKSGAWLLIVSWVLGLLLGGTYGYRIDWPYVVWLREAASGNMTIMGLLFVLYLPLLLSALAVYFKAPHWLIPICFSKAFIFASCASALFVAFGSAAWLVSFFLQFSDLCTIPFFYLFLLRNISGANVNTRSDLLVCCAVSSLVGFVDIRIISPYLVRLIDI